MLARIGLSARWLAGLCAGLLLGTVPAHADGEYAILVAGTARGQMTVVNEGQTRRVSFSFVDRGRGPDVSSVLRTDANGLPLELSVKGVSYLKVPVDEQFRRQGDLAVWTSSADRGNTPAPGFYVQHEMTSDVSTALARALLSSKDRTLPLLPSGRASIEKVLTRDIDTANGKRKATLYFIEGIGFSPSPLWLDDSRELIFEGNVWLSGIRKGAEAAVPELLRAQDEALEQREIAQAQKLARHSSTAVVFQNVSIYDATARQARRSQTVIVRGERIEAVGAAGSVAIPAGAQVIDGRGKTLLPGLFDMHVHVSSNSDGLMYLAAGITSVRDLANDMDSILARRKAFDSGRLPGPRIFLAGMVDGKGPLAGPTKLLVDTPDEARAVVEKLASNGYPQVKLYSSLKPELVPVIVEAAHAKGMRVSGHIPAGMTMEQAVRAGYDEVQHANFWMLNFMGPEINSKTNGMTRFLAVAEHGRELDLNSKPVADFIALLQQRHTSLDPTLTVIEDTVLGEPGQPPSSMAAMFNRLPPLIARASIASGTAKDAEARKNQRESFVKLRQFFKKVHDAGIPMVAGTDGMAGVALPRELEIYVEAGLTPSQALYLATLGAANVAGEGKRLGSIETGKLADLLLVDGDPTVRIGDVRNATLVMKSGVQFSSNEMWQAAGVRPR